MSNEFTKSDEISEPKEIHDIEKFSQNIFSRINLMISQMLAKILSWECEKTVKNFFAKDNKTFTFFVLNPLLFMVVHLLKFAY